MYINIYKAHVLVSLGGHTATRMNSARVSSIGARHSRHHLVNAAGITHITNLPCCFLAPRRLQQLLLTTLKSLPSKHDRAYREAVAAFSPVNAE